MKLSEILRAGKQRIQTLGWCQGDEEAIFVKSGKCCAATALSGSQWTWQQGEQCCRLFERVNGLEYVGIADWNDKPERTVEEVLAAFDKAIAAAEELEKENV